VLVGTLTLHYGSNGEIYHVRSSLATAIDAPKQAQITAKRALEAAIKHAGEGASLEANTEPKLVVVDAKTVHQGSKRSAFSCLAPGLSTPKDNQTLGWIYLLDA
jgi:hypothetical protein